MSPGDSKHDSELALPICRTTYKLNYICKAAIATVHKKHYNQITQLHIAFIYRKIQNFSIYCIFTIRLIV